MDEFDKMEIAKIPGTEDATNWVLSTAPKQAAISLTLRDDPLTIWPKKTDPKIIDKIEH